jgi:hypothetical protein
MNYEENPIEMVLRIDKEIEILEFRRKKYIDQVELLKKFGI